MMSLLTHWPSRLQYLAQYGSRRARGQEREDLQYFVLYKVQGEHHHTSTPSYGMRPGCASLLDNRTSRSSTIHNTQYFIPTYLARKERTMCTPTTELLWTPAVSGYDSDATEVTSNTVPSNAVIPNLQYAGIPVTPSRVVSPVVQVPEPVVILHRLRRVVGVPVVMVVVIMDVPTGRKTEMAPLGPSVVVVPIVSRTEIVSPPRAARETITVNHSIQSLTAINTMKISEQTNVEK